VRGEGPLRGLGGRPSAEGLGEGGLAAGSGIVGTRVGRSLPVAVLMMWMMQARGR
jgi:hypothetical protein